MSTSYLSCRYSFHPSMSLNRTHKSWSRGGACFSPRPRWSVNQTIRCQVHVRTVRTWLVLVSFPRIAAAADIASPTSPVQHLTPPYPPSQRCLKHRLHGDTFRNPSLLSYRGGALSYHGRAVRSTSCFPSERVMEMWWKSVLSPPELLRGQETMPDRSDSSDSSGKQWSTSRGIYEVIGKVGCFMPNSTAFVGCPRIPCGKEPDPNNRYQAPEVIAYR